MGDSKIHTWSFKLTHPPTVSAPENVTPLCGKKRSRPEDDAGRRGCQGHDLGEEKTLRVTKDACSTSNKPEGCRSKPNEDILDRDSRRARPCDAASSWLPTKRVWACYGLECNVKKGLTAQGSASSQSASSKIEARSDRRRRILAEKKIKGPGVITPTPTPGTLSKRWLKIESPISLYLSGSSDLVLSRSSGGSYAFRVARSWVFSNLG